MAGTRDGRRRSAVAGWVVLAGSSLGAVGSLLLAVDRAAGREWGWLALNVLVCGYVGVVLVRQVRVVRGLHRGGPVGGEDPPPCRVAPEQVLALAQRRGSDVGEPRERIALIRALRSEVPGLGLRDAKESVDEATRRR